MVRTSRTRRASTAKGPRRAPVRTAEKANPESIRSAQANPVFSASWLPPLAMMVVGILVAVQPISADDFWWQLSRGRAVWQGTLTPSATLLTMESRAEADWLGGLPIYGVYQTLGAAGLMVCRVAVVGVLLSMMFRSLKSSIHVAGPRMLVIGFALIALAADLDPVPGLFDLLGILWATWWCWPAFYRRSCEPTLSRLCLKTDPSGRPATPQIPLSPAAQRMAGESAGRGADFPIETGRKFLARESLVVAAIFMAWANVATGFAAAAGLMLIAAVCDTVAGRKAQWVRWFALVGALVGGSVNPRGVLAWTDSWVSLTPAWVTSPAALEGTPWAALTVTPWGFGEWTFFALTLVWIASRGQIERCRLPDRWLTGGNGTDPAHESDSQPTAMSRWRRAMLLPIELLPFAGMQWLAWSSAANLPLATVWLAAELALLWRGLEWGDDGTVMTDPASIKRPMVPGLGFLSLGFVGESGRVRDLLKQSLASLLLIVATLFLSGLPRTFGWGISSLLDHRLLLMALEPTQPHGTALADQTRSAGMLAWILPRLPAPAEDGQQKALRLQDIPSRAITGGRFVRNQLLLDDLRRGRLMRYWREDGSPGGFRLLLDDRNTTLLCVSNRNLALIRGLEPLIWKPLSLDSPVIPYAAAGDAAYVRRMINVLRDRETVEYQDWQYSLPVSTGSPFDRDWLGLRPVLADPMPVRNQGDVFRAMDLHYAALRVLFVGRQEFPGSTAIDRAVIRCQQELADQESIDSGRASWFRYWASRKKVGSESLPPWIGPPQRGHRWVSGDGADERAPADAGAIRQLRQLVEAYLRRGPEALLDAPGADPHPQLLYAMLCGAIESGQYDRADQLIRSLRGLPVDDSLLALVEQRAGEVHRESAESGANPQSGRGIHRSARNDAGDETSDQFMRRVEK